MEHNSNKNNRWDEWDNKAYRPYQESPNRYDSREQDPDTYRGAYRQDISSDHQHVTTYNGFGAIRNQESPRQSAMNRDRHQRRNDYYENLPDFYENHANRRHEQHPHASTNFNQEWEERTRRGPYNHNGARFDDDWANNNFNEEYAPDNYRHRRGENAGNMAGSLSFGYDGDRNANPEAYRRYEPLSGEIRHRQEPIRNQNQNQNRDYRSGQQNARERWGHY